jgi:hypothetical protein
MVTKADDSIRIAVIWDETPFSLVDKTNVSCEHTVSVFKVWNVIVKKNVSEERAAYICLPDGRRMFLQHFGIITKLHISERIGFFANFSLT